MPKEEEEERLMPNMSPRGNRVAVADASSDSEGDDSSEGPNTEPPCDQWMLLTVVIDIVAWVIFLYLVLPAMNDYFYVFCAVTAALMLLWRLYRAFMVPAESVEEVPYTTGYVNTQGKELFLVATIHISPKAKKDVEEVIETTRPDVAMIELDDERLDRMRDRDVPARDEEAPAQPAGPMIEDLQPIRITRQGSPPCTIHAQRALWNAEWSDQLLSGEISFDECNNYGLASDASWQGNIAVVQRGSPNNEFAPYALKAHNAHKAGAEAVLVIDNKPTLIPHRIGSASVTADLQVALKTCSCGFPPIPLLLLPKVEGEKLRDLCRQSGPPMSAEFQIVPDAYPRRTLRLRLCQACALVFSGIGVLYGIIQCFAVEVGGEFLAAEETALALGIPCRCIDVDLNRFWSRLGLAVVPTPCNLFLSLTAWLAFPRVAFTVLFPPRGNIDVVGGMFLHGASFPLKTWLAFILAGFCASFVTNKVLELFGYGAEKAAEKSGAVKSEDADVVQTWIMLLAELYILPRVYDAVAASRDEAMYQSIVRKSRKMGAKRMVVVVGAGHANGILHRARTFGL